MPDLISFLNMDLFWLIAALGGGAIGAAIGANWAFGMTGVMILVGLGVSAGTGDATLLNYGAFGPVFGPHIAFSGGQIAAAYAGYKGYLAATGGGKDVNTPLISLGKPDVLIVGALGGAAGYVVERLVAMIPWFGGHTDSVAVTVFSMGILARLVWGKKGAFFFPGAPSGDSRWLAWQEKPSQYLTLGAFAGLLAGGLSLMIASHVYPLGQQGEEFTLMIDNAHVLPFAISAVTILFLAAGIKMPVTHHMTITAALASVVFFNATGSGVVGLIGGAVFGALAAALGEFIAKISYYKGDTHIDPPAGAIFIMNTLLAVVALALGVGA